MPAPCLASLRDDLADLLGDDARVFRVIERAAWVVVPLIFAIVVIGCGTGPEPRRNWYGNMLGHDFSQIWVAGRVALEGRAAESYDLHVHAANLEAAFGPDCRFAWHYPPIFLLPAAAMAFFEPQAAFILWTTLSFSVFALAMRIVAGRRDAAIVALAHPLVFSNLAYGQNGLLTAALASLGAVLVDRRPYVAGLCFGLLAYKPQLAVLAPFLLLVTGRLVCLGACMAAVVGLCLASLALFGAAPWIGFIDTLGLSGRLILRDAVSGLDLNASAFGAVRLAGGSIGAAWALQATVAAAAIFLTAQAWRKGTVPHLRAAAYLSAMPLISPYVPVYDLAPLVPATLLLALAAHRAGGLDRRERSVLVISLLAGVLRTGAEATGLCFGFGFALIVFACVQIRIHAPDRGPYGRRWRPLGTVWSPPDRRAGAHASAIDR